MAISVTTRAVKGSSLSYSEMDANLNNLAVSATTSQEGNVQLSNATTSTSTTLAATPLAVKLTNDAIDAVDAKAFVKTDLYTNASGLIGTTAIANITGYDFIEVECKDDGGNQYSVISHFRPSITLTRQYLAITQTPGSSGGKWGYYIFNSNVSFTAVQGTGQSLWDGVVRITGINYE